MGYFDGLVDASFKKDSQGKDLFFPWGVLAKGYVLETAEKKNQIRKVLKNTYMFMFPIIILVQVVFGVKLNLILLVIFMAWFLWWIGNVTKGLAKSTETMKMSEAYKNSAKSHNLWILVLLELTSFMFVAVSVFILIYGNAPLIGWTGIIFFGLCTAAIGYMIASKISSKKVSGGSNEN
jgi:hypothetical protein